MAKDEFIQDATKSMKRRGALGSFGGPSKIGKAKRLGGNVKAIAAKRRRKRGAKTI